MKNTREDSGEKKPVECRFTNCSPTFLEIGLDLKLTPRYILNHDENKKVGAVDEEEPVLGGRVACPPAQN